MELQEKGTVVETRGKNALVQAVKGAHCEGCGASKVCRGGGGDEKVVEAVNEIGASAGDTVLIALPAGALLKASFKVYIVPVIGLLAGAGIAQVSVRALAGEQAAGMAAGIGGLLGAIFAVLALRWQGRREGRNEPMLPRIVKIV